MILRARSSFIYRQFCCWLYYYLVVVVSNGRVSHWKLNGASFQIVIIERANNGRFWVGFLFPSRCLSLSVSCKLEEKKSRLKKK